MTVEQFIELQQRAADLGQPIELATLIRMAWDRSKVESLPHNMQHRGLQRCVKYQPPEHRAAIAAGHKQMRRMQVEAESAR